MASVAREENERTDLQMEGSGIRERPDLETMEGKLDFNLGVKGFEQGNTMI